MGDDMDETARAEVTPTATSVPAGEVPAPALRSEVPRGMATPAQMPTQPGVVGCPTCGGQPGADRPMMQMASSFVYAIGRIEARFPTPSVEKEFAQAAGRAQTAGKTDQQTFHEVLSQRQNRYLARQLCWVLTVQGLETYILQPRDPADFELLVDAIRPQPSPPCDVVSRRPDRIGTLCNGLMVPIVAATALLVPGTADQRHPPSEACRGAARRRPRSCSIRKMRDRNVGANDEHRALNYLAMRYPAIYAKAAKEFARDFSLSSVEVRPSPLSGTRRIVEVIFGYTNRNTDFTEKFAVRVDVTGEFPFLVTKLSPYFDR